MRLIRSRSWKTALIALTIGSVGLVLQPSAVAGGLDPVFRVSPSFQNVSVGRSVEVDIVVENAPTFASYEFHLAFDPSVLAFVSITGGGDILEDAGRDPLCLGPDPFDLQNAIVSYACASTGGSGGPFGSGVLARLAFRALCLGDADLAFVPVGKDLSVDAVNLGDVLGDSIAAQGVSGQVNINGIGCVNPVLIGDANCNGSVNAIDAALILQISAELLGALSCEDNADINENGSIDSIDAALVLQFVAGLLDSL